MPTSLATLNIMKLDPSGPLDIRNAEVCPGREVLPAK